MARTEYYGSITTLPPDMEESSGRNRVATVLAIGVAAVAVVVVAKGVEAATSDASIHNGSDTCTDGGHQLINLDGQSFDELAAQQQALRKYDIDGASLAQANPTLAALTQPGTTSYKINFKGEACLTDPGPQVPGIIRVDGKTTDAAYAAENYLHLPQLRAMNPGVSANGAQVLPKGDILKVAKDPDMSLFKRVMTEPDLRAVGAEIYPGSLVKQKALINKIKAANPSLDDGVAAIKGADLFLPPVPDKDNPALLKENVTNAAIALEYADTYKKLGVNQVVTPQVQKPVQVDTNEQAAEQTAIKKMIALGGKWVNAGKLMLMFLGLGLTPIEDCGAVGSMEEESGLNPQRVQIGFGPDSLHFPWAILGRGGYGIAQWTAAWRQRLLIKDANAQGVPAGNFAMQVNHVKKELTTYYPRVLTELRSAHTIPQATSIWTFGYEGPSIPHEDVREQLAEGCITQYQLLYVPPQAPHK